MKKIFLLEDDKNFGSVLKSYLEMNDYFVKWVDDGALAIFEYKKMKFDICILDIMLPNTDGFTVAGKIKSIDRKMPVIFLTAKTLKRDIIQGYKVGADDYVSKPFDSEVLLCKIKAVLNRSNEDDKLSDFTKFTIGNSFFDYEIREISTAGITKRLSPKEAELLKLLCLHKNNVLSRSKALSEIWGDDNYFTGRSMDVFITKLRKYLQKDKYLEIVNVHGSGYRLTEKP